MMDGFIEQNRPHEPQPWEQQPQQQMSQQMQQQDLTQQPESFFEDPNAGMGQSPLGTGLPGSGSYGVPQPAITEQIAKLAVGTGLTIGGVEVLSIDELPTLFYFLTDNWRHFQLTNLKAKDQRYLDREIEDIHMLSCQVRKHRLCKEKQVKLLNSIYFYKSRSDMNRMTEREIWTLQTSSFQQQEIKRPKEGGGSFLSFFTDKLHGGGRE
jgi:hypothetical protein